MASPRITKTMREGIVKNTIEHTFNKEIDALAERRHKLADRAYNEQFTPSQIKALNELGDDFLKSDDGVYLNINGKSVNLQFAKDEHRLTGQKYGYFNRFTPSKALTKDVEKYLEDKEELDGRVRNATIQLTATLESVQSFKKLRAVWPQGEKFYDMYDVDSETKAGVPAVVITELNKLLGITK